MFRNDMKFISGQILHRCRFQIQHPILIQHVCSTGLMTHFSDFFSQRGQRSDKSIFIFVNEFLSPLFLECVFCQLLRRITLKKAEESGFQIFFKIGVLEIFASFRRKHLCWSPEGLKACNCIKKETHNTGVFW